MATYNGYPQDEQQNNAARNTVAVGSLIGAGALGYRYRREIGTGIKYTGEFASKFAAAGVEQLARSAKFKQGAQNVATFGRALSHATDNRSIISHFKNPERFNKRWDESVASSVAKRSDAAQSEFGGRQLKALKELKQLRLKIKSSRLATFETHRKEAIFNQLNKDLSKEMEKGLGSALIVRGEENKWFYKATRQDVSDFTEALLDPNSPYQYKPKFKNEEARQKFENKLFEAVDAYRNQQAKGWQSTNGKKNPLKEALEISQKKIEKGLREAYLKKHSRSDGVFLREMEKRGLVQPTIGDLLYHKRGNLLASEEGRIRTTRDGHKDHIDARMASKAKRYSNLDIRYEQVIADPFLFMNKQGELIDFGWMAEGGWGLTKGFRDNFQVPFLQFNPLDLMHFTTFEGIKEAPQIAFKKMGTIDPGLHGSVSELKHPLANNQDAAVGVLARNYINTPDGKVYDTFTGEVVKENVYQASGRFGMLPRSMAGMANLHTQNYATRQGLMGSVAKLFDVGKQEVESAISRSMSAFTKFDNYEWGPNVLRGHQKWYKTKGEEGLSPESTFKIVTSQFEAEAKPFSDDVVEYINERVMKAYGDIGVDLTKLNTEEEIMETFARMAKAMEDPTSNIARLRNDDGTLNGIEAMFGETWRKYHRNNEQFLSNRRILSDDKYVIPEVFSALDMSHTELVDKADDVKRLIHMHVSRQLKLTSDPAERVTVGTLIQEGIEGGALTQKDLRNANYLDTLTELRTYRNDVYAGGERADNALSDFSIRITEEGSALGRSIQAGLEDFNPTFAMGPGQDPPQYFGLVSTMSVNKSKGVRWALEQYNEATAAGVSPVVAALEAAGAVMSQPFAGRKNLGDVTTATLPFYYLSERLDNAVAQLGLGLSQQNRGSAQSILMNQFGRRIVLPYVAYQQAMWLDGMTGDFFSDNAAEAYANMHQDVGGIKEILGLNDIGRQWGRVFSGSDQITETPLFKAFNFATFGLFGDSRSAEEIEEWYESGETAVRKGRYWGIGSNTPYTGGKVDRYVPNWYRRIKSDYKFTDTMYGSESEYWANHWMPTLTNPLAPIRHYITDRYHYENKHEEDRPYPITGGFAEIDQIPLIGPALDNTIGRIIKPRREHPGLEKAHREYLEEINQNVTAQYELASQGGVMQGMPAGGYNLAQGYGVGGGIGAGSALPTEEEYAMMIGGAGGATADSRAQLANINTYYSEVGGPSLGSTGKNVRSITTLEDLRDPDVIADLADIGTMGNVSGTLRDSFYSASELAGIYGFSAKWMSGFEESGRGMTLEESTRMTSYARSWWDLELGGLGGQLSEIGRRYVPRDPNKNYWNPIRNTMPEWLPGAEYFTDFKHGDPYVKIANGEMRLPGEAYETLYKLHPDALGEYGAFDRFRILADVAPYSENYKFYRKMVSQMNESGLLTEDMVDEYAEIRDQVSERKKKYRFYNRRFDNADVNYETVTVTKIIDATTFLTKEHPNNPIKMAGIKVKADDEQANEWLGQFIYGGAKLKIAVDADPLNRVRDDTYNTMRAVVYANKNPEGTMMPYGIRGQSLNFILANRRQGGFLGTGIGGESNVSVHDDGTATSTHALFSKDMITVGKMWESLTHDILPKVPIVGTIADKFLQVRSPLEMYKRQEIYGKAWRPWTEPISGWVKPMLDTIASSNPAIAAAQGAGIGWLFTRGSGKYFGTRVGAVVGGGMATARVFLEHGREFAKGDSDYTWIPERREKEREINEYFDKLKYVKYRGLYEKAKKEALRREGINLDEIIAEHEERGGENKAYKKNLEGVKKWLSMSKKLGYGDSEAVNSKLDLVNESLKKIDADRPNQQLGKYSMLALRYKAEYESTLYGADPNGDMTKIFRALPSKDREFFTEFMKAAPKEREEILRLVPKDQRKFYQAKWGLDVDKDESLRSYFSTHTLPGENWSGWKVDQSLDNYKIKVIQNEGLELTDFGFWGDDVQRAENSNVEDIKISGLSSSLSINRLTKVLRGAGLQDVEVSMDVSPQRKENKINLAMDILKDRNDEILQEINNNLGGLFA